MRKLAALLVIAIGAQAAFADAPAAVSPPQPFKKILVWVMRKDPTNVEELEIDILEALANHQTNGDRFTVRFPKGLPASTSEAIADMRQSGCDALLVLRRRSTITWDSPSKEHAESSLRSFLRLAPQLINPKNQSGANNEAPIEVADPYRDADWEVVKGEFFIFDLSSEKMVWRSDVQVKSAKDLPQARYYKLVASTVVDALAGGGFILPGKR